MHSACGTRLTAGGLPHSEIPGSQFGYQLPWAFRRFPRLSSPLDAKTFTVCPLWLDHTYPTPHPPSLHPAFQPDFAPVISAPARRAPALLASLFRATRKPGSHSLSFDSSIFVRLLDALESVFFAGSGPAGTGDNDPSPALFRSLLHLSVSGFQRAVSLFGSCPTFGRRSSSEPRRRQKRLTQRGA